MGLIDSSSAPSKNEKKGEIGVSQADYENEISRSNSASRLGLSSNTENFKYKDVRCHDDLGTHPAKKAKRLKDSRRKCSTGVRREDKPRRLVDVMPVEIVFQIYCQLEPRDLLHLCWSSKVFARSLLKPHSAWVWRVVRERAAPDLPPIHSDLTEQKYSLLAFGSHCQWCGTVCSLDPDWFIRRRWCSNCQDALLDERYCGDSDIPASILDHSMIVHYSRAFEIALRTEVNEIERMMETIQGDQWKEYVSHCHKDRKALVKHAKKCVAWSSTYAKNRRKELRDIRKSRKQTIQEKLIAMGFAPEIVARTQWQGIREVDLPRPLSETDWLAIKPNVVARVAKEQNATKSSWNRSLRKVIIKEYRTWYKGADPGRDLWPYPAQFQRSSTFKNVLDEYIDSNLQVLIRAGPFCVPWDLDLEMITTRFQELASTYSRTVFIPLFESIPEALRLGSARDTFALARTMFKYRKGSRTSRTSIRYPFPDDFIVSNWGFDPLASKIINNIIVCGGWDPNVMTSSELDDKDIRVECLTCAQEDPLRIGTKMRWRHTPRHSSGCHLEMFEGEVDMQWRILVGEEKESYVKHAEEPALQGPRVLSFPWIPRPGNNRPWKCLFCSPNNSHKTKAEILSHISSRHPDAQPEIKPCYIENFDGTYDTHVTVKGWSWKVDPSG